MLGGNGDMPTMEALNPILGGVLGGMVPLIGKYVIDRLAETHKAAVSVAAKRKERYQEKQASAIASVHERLSLYNDVLRGLHLYETRSLAEDQEKRIQEEIVEADRVRRDFERNFAANEIYLPEALASDVQKVSLILRQALWTHREKARSANIDGIMEARDAAKNLLQDLKGKFRELLSEKDAGQASASGSENIGARRSRPRRRNGRRTFGRLISAGNALPR
jgi:hypothetical protein